MANKLMNMSAERVNDMKLKMDALSTAQLPQSEKEYYNKKIEELKAIQKSINFSGDNTEVQIKLDNLMSSILKSK